MKFFVKYIFEKKGRELHESEISVIRGKTQQLFPVEIWLIKSL